MKDILFVLVVFVIIKAILTVRQTRQLKSLFTTLEISGDVYFGQDRSFPLAGIVIIVAVNERGRVTDARQFKLLKMLIPARVEDYSEIIGKNLNKMNPADVTGNKREQKALSELVKNYNKGVK